MTGVSEGLATSCSSHLQRKRMRARPLPPRLENVLPGLPRARSEQVPRRQRRQLRRQQLNPGRRDPVHDVVRGEVARVLQPRGGHQFAKRSDGAAVEVEDALCLVRHDQRALADRVLRGDDLPGDFRSI